MTSAKIIKRWVSTGIGACFAASIWALEIPPEIGQELNGAREAWRKAEELTDSIRGVHANDVKLDEVIDARDAAYERAILLFEAALKKDPGIRRRWRNSGGTGFRGGIFLLRGAIWKRRGGSTVEGPSRLPASGVQFSDAAWARGLKGLAQLLRDRGATPERCGSRTEKALTNADKSDLLRTLGAITERAGETGTALDYYRAALSRFPADPRNTISLAVGLCAAGNPGDAAALLDPWEHVAAAATEPPVDYPKDRPEILALGLYTLAVAKEELGLLDDALALYRRTAEASKLAFSNPGEVAENARMAIARLEDKLDEFADNENSLEPLANEIRKQNEMAKAHLPQPLPQKPVPDTERAAFADSLALCGHGINSKKQALRDPEFLNAMARVRDNELKAKQLEDLPGFNLFQFAENSFLGAIKRYSKFSRPYYEMSLCELQMHRYSSARSLLDAAALYNPNDVATLSLRGSVLLELGQWEEAANVFRKVTALDGDNGAAHFGLGRALTALRLSEAMCSEALSAFSRAMRLGITDERMYVARMLTAKDGVVYTGHIVEDENDWIVMEEGVAPFRIARMEVEKVIDGPGLRERAAAALVAYRRGEKPPDVKRYIGRKHPEDEREMLFRRKERSSDNDDCGE